MKKEPRPRNTAQGAPPSPAPHITGSDLGRGSGDHAEISQPPYPSNDEDEDDDGSGEGDNGESEDSEEDEEIFPHLQNLQKCDWGLEYPKCPVFAKMWLDSHTPDANWPKGVKIANGRMYCDEKLCVPTSLSKAWIREHHNCWAILVQVGCGRI